jgi:Periplasmic binding protein
LIAGMVVLVPSEVPDGTANGGPALEVADGQTASGWGETVNACSDREQQVQDDGYSPPCFTFEGDNGGATTRGVTGDSITVSYRMTADPNLFTVLADIGGIEFEESNEQIARTAEGLVEYFNRNYQLYGRQLRFQRVNGRGSMIQEFTGGGQEGANNDALQVANEVQAFADITAVTQPYADALTRNEVINIGAPFLSRQWFTGNRPYSWSNFPDCSVVAEAATEYGVKRMFGKPARYAGGDLANQPRRIALITPDNLEYRRCGDYSEEIAAEAGFEFAYRTNYVFDMAQIQSQAVNVLAQLRANDITTVACACDPLMLLYLAQQANQQNYRPEWSIVGVGFIDLDLVGQMVQNTAGDQWTRAFGGSAWGIQEPNTTSAGYRAYTSVRDDQPSLLVDLLYYQIYELVIGIQMAGPNLTPETFEAGMFAYPGGSGPAGTWDFYEEHYTGVTDAREIWWDPNAPSPFNGQAGTYRDNGQRYQQGELTEGDPEVFR